MSASFPPLGAVHGTEDQVVVVFARVLAVVAGFVGRVQGEFAEEVLSGGVLPGVHRPLLDVAVAGEVVVVMLLENVPAPVIDRVIDRLHLLLPGDAIVVDIRKQLDQRGSGFFRRDTGFESGEAARVEVIEGKEVESLLGNCGTHTRQRYQNAKVGQAVSGIVSPAQNARRIFYMGGRGETTSRTQPK